MFAASILVVFSFQESGITPHIWAKSIFLLPLIIGIFCWFALFSWEFIVARFWPDAIATMFPLRLIKQRVYMGYVLSTLIIGFPYFLIIYSLPLRFQVVNEKSPLIAGVALLPMLVSIALGSTIGGAVNGKRNNTCPTLVIAACFMVIGTGLFTTLSDSVTIQSRAYGFQIFVGLGYGLTVSTTSLGVSLECEVRDSGKFIPRSGVAH
jgi:hypothetical protein